MKDMDTVNIGGPHYSHFHQCPTVQCSEHLLPARVDGRNQIMVPSSCNADKKNHDPTSDKSSGDPCLLYGSMAAK